MSGGESAALEVGVALVVIAVVAALAALELQFRPRLRLIGRDVRPPVEQPAPPPEMKPSAIVRKAAADDKPS
jgi:hypothetical protein